MFVRADSIKGISEWFHISIFISASSLLSAMNRSVDPCKFCQSPLNDCCNSSINYIFAFFLSFSLFLPFLFIHLFPSSSMSFSPTFSQLISRIRFFSIHIVGDNFFQYACGAWNKKNIIPEDKSSFSTFEVSSFM